MLILKIKYKQQKAKTIAECQGYQNLDPKHHPVVQNALKAAELQSQVSHVFVETSICEICLFN